MSGVMVEYFIGLYLIGISLDAPRTNVAKIIGGIVLVVAAILGVSLVK